MSGLRVGVDGGQSRLRLAVVGDDRVHEAPGFSYHAGDPITATIDAVERAWASAGAAGPVERVVLGLTGLPSSANRRDALSAGIARVLGAREVVLGADNVTAHAGALPSSHGVALTVGTGVGCLVVDPAAGTIRRLDGWGHLLGDDGSAFAIGRAGIAAVLRAVDGRGSATALDAAAQHRFGPLPQLTERIYTSPRMVDDIARFAPDVVAAAAGGDPVSIRVIRSAAAELAHTAASAVAFVTGAGAGAVPVTLVGRLVAAGGPLVDAFHEALAAQCPRASPVPPAGSSLDGARRLALLDHCGPYGGHLHVYRGF
ncbi:ATPase [Asanoa ishikariensis]|uniref:BadF-type ATPase n=1 Tax=Asanoa ishikariensis TaxID=137265 RepID=A0A1H3UA30_9ACTN|nr:BadF/BadG/BcrA/BcrD ATPase family protein [Asanoa ishikariensis]GIF64042.1 ATPase [Asanoa ishikariensis]SDZ58951.1 BadF-type ATPase [Asanoa ishikariensis]